MAAKNQLTKSDYLSFDELKKLLEGLHQDKLYMWELYVRLSFCTALRVSDVLSLTWQDVLNKKYLVKTEKKTKKTRKILISEFNQQKIFTAYKLLGMPNPAEFIFHGERRKSAYTSQLVNRTIKTWKYKYKLKIGNFSTHTFRKTFGRYVYDMHKNKSEALVLINAIFQHANINTTKIYIGLRDDEINSVFMNTNI